MVPDCYCELVACNRRYLKVVDLRSIQLLTPTSTNLAMILSSVSNFIPFTNELTESHEIIMHKESLFVSITIVAFPSTNNVSRQMPSERTVLLHKRQMSSQGTFKWFYG